MRLTSCFLFAFIFVPRLVFSQYMSIDVDYMVMSGELQPNHFLYWKSHGDRHLPGEIAVYKSDKPGDSLILFDAKILSHAILGEAKWFDEQGRLIQKANYSGKYGTAVEVGDINLPFTGTLHGERKVYGALQNKKDNFILLKEESYNNGKKHGIQNEYYTNENIFLSETFNNGIKEGTSLEKYENGNVKENGWYANNNKEGWWYSYNKESTIHSKIKFSSGSPDTIFMYHSGGILKSINYFSSNAQPSFEYDSLGRLKHYRYFNREGIADSIEVSYYENGERNFMATVKNGHWHGVYKHWYKNGILAEKGNYTNGNQTGIWTYYNKSGKLIKTEKKIPLPEPEIIPPPIEVLQEEMIYEYITVTETPEFPGGYSQHYNEKEYKLDKLKGKKIEAYAKIDKAGNVNYKVITELNQKELTELQRYLKDKLSRVKTGKLNGRTYACEMKLLLKF